MSVSTDLPVRSCSDRITSIAFGRQVSRFSSVIRNRQTISLSASARRTKTCQDLRRLIWFTVALQDKILLSNIGQTARKKDEEHDRCEKFVQVVQHHMTLCDLIVEFPNRLVTSIQRVVEILMISNDTGYGRHEVRIQISKRKDRKKRNHRKRERQTSSSTSRRRSHIPGTTRPVETRKTWNHGFHGRHLERQLSDWSYTWSTDQTRIRRVNSIRYVQSGGLSSLTVSHFRQEQQSYVKKTINKVDGPTDIVLSHVLSLIWPQFTTTGQTVTFDT